MLKINVYTNETKVCIKFKYNVSIVSNTWFKHKVILGALYRQNMYIFVYLYCRR